MSSDTYKPFLRERVLYANDNEILSYHKGEIIYRANGNERKSVKIGNFLNFFSLTERLMRKEPRCGIKVKADLLLFSYAGKVFKYTPSQNSIIVEHEFKEGMNNPLAFLGVYNQKTGENDVYYGEYFWNINKGPVAIYKRTMNKWEKVYEFPRESITHIHNVIYDKYRRVFYVLTGDDDKESGIWMADAEFKRMEPILRGKQQYRACVAFPTKKGLFYATDTPLEQNNIYFLPLDSDISQRVISLVYHMPGPCIYGTEQNGKMYFSTSVEPDSTLPKWKYRITRKLGKGVQSNESHIITGSEDAPFRCIASFSKDFLPLWLFQFGNIIFPCNEGKETICSLQAVKPKHNISIRV